MDEFSWNSAIRHPHGERHPINNNNPENPNPSPTELLIEVHALALNPVDHHQRDTGFFIQEYPAIIGSDVAGVIISSGPSTRAALRPGTRVTALASSFFNGGADYGAFQRRVLVSEETVSVLPDGVSFVEGAVFPLAAFTSWNGWVWAGLLPTATAGLAGVGEGVFVWGASSSIGALAVQEAKVMGFVVYATASPQHHDYIRGLGADRVFDYKDTDVLDQIVRAAGADGVSIRIGYHATGNQQLAADVLDALRGEREGEKSKLAIAPILDLEWKVPDGVEAAFVYPPQDRAELKERNRAIFVDWLEGKLASKQVVASPHIKVIKGGLESVNGALDELKAGVSCLKIVVEL
ncbi:zinc-binding oxidoreductase-like protein CipB [Penicillium manginii]|uniref:zinc-binding oxidoreductase-like protein CipB n=1 Tax=Penicillium manginii TaxID=203109 RepID=UPI002546B895|nr:zinc-binding oxidoreductase-like protein CipB [Penicillium manginii]KAJ5754642.1 zinc-binding oxidoreductase-like protein CipB [Penicillium manginii]